MPVPSAPPPGLKARTPAATPARVPKPAEQTDAPTTSRPHMVNDLLPFLGFVEQHPVGSTVKGLVDSYSSHGAYVSLGDARGYVPLRLMAEKAPRSAREVMKLGDTVDLVVVSFNPTRRSIDLCVPGMEPAEVKAAAAAPAKRTRKKAAPPAPTEAAPAKRTTKKASPAPEVAPVAPDAPDAAAAPVRRTRKKAAAATEKPNSRDAVAAGGSGAREKPVKQTGKKAAASAPASTAPTERPRASTKKASEPAPAPAKRSRKKAAS
jgi:predicted RNA-binding protein with RPS1 domain